MHVQRFLDVVPGGAGQVPVANTREVLRRAVAHLESLQEADGCWEAEMVWNTMLLSQYVIVRCVTGRFPLPARERQQIIKHYAARQLADGSWPMHIESEGYMFFTCLAYVSLRLLGVSQSEPSLARARDGVRARDVRSIPTWGKFWLAMLGLYEYEGMNPVPPELFLLPESSPFHPNHIYCQTRYTYMAIAYLYGSRFRADVGPLRDALREELYDRPYTSIDFSAHRERIAATDLYVAPNAGLKLAFRAFLVYERYGSRRLRDKARALCLRRIEFEQRASRFRGLSPVNGLLNCLALYADDPAHPLLDSSLKAMETWQWDDQEEGIRLCGARSATWDTSFALRTLTEVWHTSARGSRAAIQRGYDWLTRTQITEELAGGEREARDPILGGFCFSAGDERWPVSDCTAEALTAMLLIHDGGELAPATSARLRDENARHAVEFILQRQNPDGGFGTYERVRSRLPLWLFNPSEMYGDCMSERSFIECSASCINALARFRLSSVTAPPELYLRVDRAIARAVGALTRKQRADGSFPGSWGVNFVFGTFHAIDALIAAGVSRQDPRVQRAAEWLLSKQKADGGWGEHWTSCLKESYVEHPESQATMTAWALLGLLHVLEPTHPALRRGVAALEWLQASDGSWPRQSQAGVFFVTCVLDYLYYKDYFPTWALARFTRLLDASSSA
jgi:squalene/oxidosqualene cyclase-like protein